MRFEWDPRKAAANLAAHRVRFSEAAAVLQDDNALTREDPDGRLYPSRAGCLPHHFGLEGEQASERAV